MARIRRRERVLVLGGGYAGVLAAARAARGGGAEVVLVDARPEFVQRIRLHQELAGDRPARLPYAPLLARRGVGFVQGYVHGLDPAAQRVEAHAPDGGRIALGYDRLVVALGSRTDAALPGVAEHAVRLDDPAQVRAAGERLAALASGRVLVVGGGATGIEVAAEVAERFPALGVTLATAGSPGRECAERGRAHLLASLARLGVELREEVRIAGVEAGRAWLEGGGALDFDLCVWCGGLRAPALAPEAGLATDALGRLRVDATLRAAGHPDIFGAGDAAVSAGGAPLRMACATALPLGAHAGENVRRSLAGQEPVPFSFAYVARFLSLGRRDGVVQRVGPGDAPRERVVLGRSAALLKEGICRMTMGVLSAEVRWGVPVYRWPRGVPERGHRVDGAVPEGSA